MSEIGPLAAVIAFYILFSLSFSEMLAIFLVSSICISFLNLLQMIIDIKRPTLDWDNPQRAMKQNLNGMFSLAIIFGFAGACVGIGILTKAFVAPLAMFLFLLAISVLGNLLLWRKVENSLCLLFAKD
jgi:ABC-2 type transport system permease protein